MMRLAATFAAILMMTVPATPKTIEKGDQSNVDNAKQVVVRTQAEWNKLWTEHGGDRQKPAVDFAKEMVLAVFLGSRPSAGYNISIVSTVQKDGKMIVQYQESMPAKGMMTAQVLTSPYHLVAIPKVAGQVAFEKVEK